MSGRIHVVGGGLAGLAAALVLTQAGRAVTVWEAGPRPGGRCRSFDDARMAMVIDNGTHLMLSGNRGLARYLSLTGAADRMTTHDAPVFPFTDLTSGRCWTLRPGLALLLCGSARPPGVSAWSLIRDTARLLRAGPSLTVADALGSARSPAFDLLWRPLTVSVLNAEPQDAAAALLAAVLRETLLKGGAACRPMLPKISLDDTLIAPALDALAQAGALLHVGRRVRQLTVGGSRVTAVDDMALGPDDRVVLAVPPWVAGDLLPGLVGPAAGAAIVNVHFRVDGLALDGFAAMTGLTGGRTDWLVRYGDRLSATVSAAKDLAPQPADEIAGLIWRDIRRLAAITGNAGLPAAPPLYRVVKERRATFAPTVASRHVRPRARTVWNNLLLAGDWVSTGLPSTMESAVRSGFAAAEIILSEDGTGRSSDG